MLDYRRQGKIVTLRFQKDAYAKLQSLVLKTEAKSDAEVVRNALRLYEALIEETEKGAKFLIKRPDSTGIQPFEVFKN